MVNSPKAKAKTTAKPTYDTIDYKKIEATYSYAAALIKTHPDLKPFFDELGKIMASTSHTPTQQEFDTISKKYTFFKNLDANQTAAELAKASDPTNYAHSIDKHVSDLRTQAEQYGVPLSEAQLLEQATLARYNGWDPAQVNENLMPFLKGASQKNLTGNAGDAQTTLTQWAAAQGISLSPEAADKMIANITFNKQSIDDVKNDLRKTYLTGAYPAYADRFAQGLDPTVVFDPIVGSIQKILEDSSIGLNDPLIKRITQSVDANGKPQVVPLYEAERMAREDPRWQKTDNAYATTASSLKNLLSTWGMGG